MKSRFLSLVAVVVAVGALAACDDKKPSGTGAPPPPPMFPERTASSSPGGSVVGGTGVGKFEPNQLAFFQPVPDGAVKETLDAPAALGKTLYFDARVSKAGDVSCATCHDFARGGSDGLATAVGTKKAKNARNTPTILNSAGAFAQGWDARSATVDEFLLTHLADANIMGSDERKLVEVATSKAAAFKKTFSPDDKLSGEMVARALSAYVKTLFTKSRFDKYLAGDTSAMTADELAGLATFVETGCASCHQGKYIGATQAQKLGVAHPWPEPGSADVGRFSITNKEMDRGSFKVSCLRNVSRTAPYLHDGSIKTLEETVRLMAHHQVGKDLDDAQVKSIVLFLGTLDGDPAKALTAKP